MINLHTSTSIYKPAKQIFDFVSTPENDFQWQYGTLASSRLSEEAGLIGSFFRSIGHFMGRRNLSTFEVTEYEPNRIYGFKSLSGPLHSQTTYTFEMSQGGTKVNISTQARAVNSAEVSEAALEKKLRKQLKENLALLKQILEAKGIALSGVAAPAVK